MFGDKMGLLDRFKKKENDFDNLPYIPDDRSLPPMPPAGNKQAMDLPPLPPIPKFPQEENKDLPPMPKMPAPHKDVGPRMIPKLPVDDIAPKLPPPRIADPELEPKDLDIGPAPALPKKRAKVFVQLNKYNDIVKTVHNMEGRINDLQNSINQIKDIRAKENEIINSWNNLLSEAKTKIEEVNSKLPSADDS